MSEASGRERSDATGFPRACERAVAASGATRRAFPREQRPDDDSRYGD